MSTRQRPMALATILMLCLAATSFLAQQAPPVRDARTAASTGTAELAGSTIAADSGRALPYVQIGLLGTDNGLIRVTSSDEAGRFRMTRLPAGRYLVSASKPPYVTAMYGARQAGRPGTAVAIADGERREDLVMTLSRGAVISGVVTDEYGRPAAGVGLAVQSSAGGTLQQQMMSLAFATPQVADDRGMYRFSGLVPGEYLVVVSRSERLDPDAKILTADEIDAAIRELREAPSAPVASAATSGSPAPAGRPADMGTTITLPPPARGGGTPAGVQFPGMMAMMSGGRGGGYAPVYYPGTVDVTAATPVKVVAGEERHGVDIVAPRVPTSSIEGVVVTPDGEPPTGTMLRLQRRGQSDISSMMLGLLGAQTRVAADGKFTLQGVPPGQYTVEARTFAQPAASPLMGMVGAASGFTPPKPKFYAAVEVTVTAGQPVTGVELRLQPGMALTGTVSFRRTRIDPPADASEVMVTLVPIVGADLMAMAASGMTRAAADGTFTIDGVIPGSYVLQAAVTGGAHMLQWMPQSVRLAGREMADLPIDITAGDPPPRDIAITLSDAQQEVAGTLQDVSGRPAPEFTILLFASDRAYWYPNSRRVLTARPGTDGRFTFSGPLGPPAGEYLLAAVTDLAPEDQYKPSFLGAVAASGLKITIAPGQQVRQDIRIAGGGHR